MIRKLKDLANRIRCSDVPCVAVGSTPYLILMSVF